MQDSNPDFWLNPNSDLGVCWIAARMLWIQYVVSLCHFAKCHENWPVTVWGMLIYLLKCPIPQWWGKWKSALESVSGSSPPPTTT